MRILWYPKEHFRLRVRPDFMFEGLNRMRTWDFHDCYRRRGIDSEIAEFTVRDPNPFDYDVVIFSKGGPSRPITRWLRRAGVCVIWDQCDPLPGFPAGLAEGLDAITTNSDELKAALEAMGAPAPVIVVYDPHEADLAQPKQHHTASDRLRVTWFGWGHNFRSFVKPILPLIQTLDFVDFAWAGPDTPENRAEWGFTPGIAMQLDPREAWRRPDSWLNFIRNSDVGIVPVFGQIKPQHKALNYMAYGIPVICSPTDGYLRLVRHGENGFIAQDESDWAKYLQLLRDPGLRQRLGERARAEVGESRSPEAVTETHRRLVETLLAQRTGDAAARRARKIGRAWYPTYRRYQRWREKTYLRRAEWTA